MAADPLVGKVLADRFAILEKIGEGGMGVVYKAKQLSVDRIIAIKVLGAHVSTDPSWVKRFHNEARAASRLDHPNTVRLIDFGQTKEGLLFIAMEFLHGRSLRTEIEKAQRLAPNRVLRIVSQVCASLAEAHGQGIIHRDIKPDNIYLVDAKAGVDYVKVLDFSVAKLDAPDAQVTRAGVVFGTPAYMSPEQGRGVPLDPRSDIYAVGIVAYEMLNGKPPFDAKIPTEVVMMHLRDKPPPLSGVAPQISTMVMKALEKEPARRQQSADQLNGECEAAFAELFPRQASGSGLHPMAEPSYSPPVAAAPVRGSAPPEQKTMMAGNPGAPPAAPPRPVSAKAPVDQKTMMATPQPSRPGSNLAASNLPPPPAPGGSSPQQKTVMADSPGPLAYGQHDIKAGANQKTMAVDLNAPRPAPGIQGTQLLPDSQGVVAYAQDAARRAREMAQGQEIPAPPAGALFWMAWVLLGIAVGLGLHFWLAHAARGGT